MGNDLVADVEPGVSQEDGIVLVDFAVDTGKAVSDEEWLDAGINAGAAGLDALSVVADPFGALLTSVFAWAMEHVHPLPDMLDKLAGSPDVVKANAETWANVSKAMDQAANKMEQTVQNDTANWYGPAIDVYKPVGLGEAKMIEAASKAASAVGAAVSGAGAAVAAVRTLVRDLIAEAVADIIKVLAREAAAMALTLGAATPVLVADVIATVAKWSTRVSEWLQKIVRSIQALADLVKRVKPVLDQVGDSLKRVQQAAKNNPLSDLSPKQQFARNAAVSGSTLDNEDEAEDTNG